MNITESSKATTAAPAVDQPIAESAGYVGGKSTVEDPSMEADKAAEVASEEMAATAGEKTTESKKNKDDTTTPKEDVAKASKAEDVTVVEEKKVAEEKKDPSPKNNPDAKVDDEKKDPSPKKRTAEEAKVADEKKDGTPPKKASTSTDLLSLVGKASNTTGGNTNTRVLQRRWICDKCKVKWFLDFNEACEHEKNCVVLQDALRVASVEVCSFLDIDSIINASCVSKELLDLLGRRDGPLLEYLGLLVNDIGIKDPNPNSPNMDYFTTEGSSENIQLARHLWKAFQQHESETIQTKIEEEYHLQGYPLDLVPTIEDIQSKSNLFVDGVSLVSHYLFIARQSVQSNGSDEKDEESAAELEELREDLEQKVRGIDDIITDIGRLFGSTEADLDLVKEFSDCISSQPHLIGVFRVARAIAILYKSFDSDVREIASSLLSKVPSCVLQEDPLVERIHSSLPTMADAVQVNTFIRGEQTCFSISILGSVSGNGGSETKFDLYLGSSQKMQRMYSPSKSLGESIRKRLKQLSLIGKNGLISQRYHTKESQMNALVDKIRGDRLCEDMILRASRDLIPMTCTDLGPSAHMHQYTSTVLSCGIPYLASLLLPNDDVAADMESALRSTITNTWATISVFGAGTAQGGNRHVKLIRAQQQISINCPTASVLEDITDCVEQVQKSRELGFVSSNLEDATKMVLSILHQDPSVIKAVQQYLADNGKYVTPNKEIDFLFQLGTGKQCENTISLAKDLITESASGMFEGTTAVAVAQKWHAQAKQAGARILVKTSRGFVEEDKDGAITRISSYLKRMQYSMTNRLIDNARRCARRLEIRLADIARDAAVLQALHEAALDDRDMVDMNLSDYILSCHYPGIKDADILFKKLRPVLHLTPKNTSDSKEWYYNSDGEPVLASNATLQANRPTAHAGYHNPRNPKDTANWGSPGFDRADHHLTTHHGYRNLTEFDLLMFTSANKLYPGWHQFKIKSGINGRSGDRIWPDCALYSMCYVDPVPCLIVKLKLATSGGVVDRNTKMTVTWMNGKRVGIDAKDERFEITSSGAITHPQAPLYSE